MMGNHVFGTRNGRMFSRHNRTQHHFRHVSTRSHKLPQFSLPLGEETVKWTVWLTEEAIWERYLTLSQIAVLKGLDRETVVRAVFEAMKGDDVERNENGEVGLQGVTYSAWTSRL